ncbi:MAG: hypothetical protein NXI32_06890 [bacterium]|nr:hypothetical protein [bacterium]
MKRSAMALTLVALVGSMSFAQESTRRAPGTREAERKEQRSAGRERREDDQKTFRVKDPDGFKAEGEPVFSGPQPGEKVSGFRAARLAGEDESKEVNPVAVGGDNPHILFFQDKTPAAIEGLFGVVDALAKIDRKTEIDLHVACVFLSDDPDSITHQFRGVSSALREQGFDLIAVSKDGRDGPGAYGLNRTVSQTIILARNGRVTRNFVFRHGMHYADPHVIGGVAELIDEDRETVAGWLAEADEEAARMRMRRDNDPQSAAKAALREKLGEFVRTGKLTREEAGELYEAAFAERR